MLNKKEKLKIQYKLPKQKRGATVFLKQGKGLLRLNKCVLGGNKATSKLSTFWKNISRNSFKSSVILPSRQTRTC